MENESPRLVPTEEAGGAIPLLALTREALTAWFASAAPEQEAWVKANGYSAIRGEILVLPDGDGGIASAMFGMGKAWPTGLDSRAFGALPLQLPEGLFRIEGLPEDPAQRELAALGWLLGTYRFNRYKAPNRSAALLVCPEGVDGARVEALARAMWLARDLINTPAEDMGPAHLEQEARDMAAAFGASVEVTVGEELLARNYPMIHRVGRAGPVPPRLIDLRWEGPDSGAGKLRITLVGKGVCFDTGGLDIKPSSAMILMKKDMGGAAVALALGSMIMSAGLSVTLRVLIPAVENSVSASSFRPGDVIPSRKGLTVENRNTDAEGRLVLGDALTEAATENPDLLFDFATLTGAARVALGADLPAMFSGSAALAAEIAAAGEAMGDPVWHMPLWPGYEGDISSSIADITNAPAGGLGGAITAALFLQRFVEDPARWAHFDVYGWTPKARPGRPEGGECHAALALFKLIEDRVTGAA